jgi:Integrase core domain
VRAMGIRDRPISPRSPWQNPYVERLIGTVRRECLDRVLIFGEAHLRQIRSSYAAYYNEGARTWRWAKTRPQVGQSSGPAPLSLSQSCLGCTTITSGYNFRKGHDTFWHPSAWKIPGGRGPSGSKSILFLPLA